MGGGSEGRAGGGGGVVNELGGVETSTSLVQLEASAGRGCRGGVRGTLLL